MRTSNLSASLIVSESECITLSAFKVWADDRFRCEATLQVQARGFGYLGRDFTFDNLPQFVAQLETAQRQLSGTAKLQPDHESGELIFEYRSLGAVLVSGSIHGDWPGRCRLEFEFACDQSYMPPFIAQLRAVLEALQTGRAGSNP
jgi:hypothetical protein